MTEKLETRTNFLQELRGEKEDPKLIELQNQFENKELDLCIMSDEQIETLNSLYKEQIYDLEKKIEDKKHNWKILKKE